MTEAARAEAFASQADKSRALAEGYVQQAIALARQVLDLKNLVTRALDTIAIPHRWVGTRLDLMGPDGQWVTGPDLKGDDARGIDSFDVIDGRLIVTYSDAVTQDLGAVVGDVVGPAEAVAGNLPVLDATGKVLADSGNKPSDFATAAQGAKADTAVQPSDMEAGLAEKVSALNAALLGVPTAPTAALGTNTDQIATMAAVKAAADAVKDLLLGGSVSSALDTLLEIQEALGNDADFAASMATALGQRQLTSQKNQANGYAGLDGSAKVPMSLLDVGTSASKLVQLDSSGRLPAVNGSLLTNISSGLTLLSAVTVSVAVAAVDITGLNGDYDEYELHLQEFAPVVSSARLQMRTSTNGGAGFDSGVGDYVSGSSHLFIGTAASAAQFGGTADAQINLFGASNGPSAGLDANAPGIHGIVRLFRPSATAYCQVQSTLAGRTEDTGRFAQYETLGARLAAADVDAIRLFFHNGNIAVGSRYKLYGVKKS